MRPAWMPKSASGVDQHLLDSAHVGAHVALPLAQIQDGITHHLSRPVIGDIAAAVRRMKGDAGASQDLIAGQQVLHVAVAAQGDGVGVLQQNELVANLAPALRSATSCRCHSKARPYSTRPG